MARWRDTLFAKVLLLALGVALLVLLLFGALAMRQVSLAQARVSAPLWASALEPALDGRVSLPAEVSATTRMTLLPGPPPPDASELLLYPRFRAIAGELRELGLPVREVRVSGRTGEAVTWLGIAQPGGAPLRWIGVRGPYEGLDVRVRSAFGFLLALAIIGVAAWKLSRRITRPVSELQRALQRFGREGWPTPASQGASADDERERARAKAPAELQELMRQFEQVAAERAALDAERRTMLAAISHDLRSPLSRIRMAAELLPEAAEGVPARREAIVRNVQAVDRLLGSFIDFARSEGEPYDEHVDLAGVVHRAAAEEPGLAVAVPADASLVVASANALALERALRNLVDNAHRHGKGPIELELQREGPTLARLSVRDHGRGIASEADRARLVLPFQRGEMGRRTPGTGLGLAIVARVAERCGGSLALEDARPGLRAVMRLPVRPATPAPGAPRAVPPHRA